MRRERSERCSSGCFQGRDRAAARRIRVPEEPHFGPDHPEEAYEEHGGAPAEVVDKGPGDPGAGTRKKISRRHGTPAVLLCRYQCPKPEPKPQQKTSVTFLANILTPECGRDRFRPGSSRC